MLDFYEIVNNYKDFCLKEFARTEDDKKYILEYINRVKTFQPCSSEKFKGFFVDLPYFDSTLSANFYRIGIFEDSEKVFLNDLRHVKQHWADMYIDEKLFQDEIEDIVRSKNVYTGNGRTFECKVENINNIGMYLNNFLYAINQLHYIDIFHNEDNRENECYTYFRITGKFDVEEVSKLLGLKPYDSFNMGDKWILGKTREFSNCSFGFCVEYNVDFNEMMAKTIKELKNKIDVLKKIKEKYHTMFFLVVVPTLIVNKTNPIMGANSEIIDFCYKTGTEIDIDLSLLNGKSYDY